MARGKFERRRKKNYGALVILWFVIIAAAVGVGFALGNRNKAEEPTNPSMSQNGEQQKPQDDKDTLLPDDTTGENEDNTQLPDNTEDTTGDTTDNTIEDPVEDIPEEDMEDTTGETDEEIADGTDTDLLPDENAPATLGEQAAAMARQQLGKAFKRGGVGPDSFDTTGLVVYCFKECGVTAPRRTAQMAEFGTAVALEDLQPGDVVIFSYDAGSGKTQYPGIYVGDGKFIAARNESYPVSEMEVNSSYFSKRFVCARRFG